MSANSNEITIPNELKITINTGIKGFQKINYTPNMTISNISNDDKFVQFNPFVKLQQSIVDSVPEKIRQKEFFNKKQFQSLINYIHSKPNKNLLYATNSGVIDNNIKITLNTIFPVNSVIYINAKPYVIVDVQWSKGDWQIDTKYKPTENNRYTSSSLKHKISVGQKQLEKLPSSVVYGVGYNGPKKQVTNDAVTIDPSSSVITGGATYNPYNQYNNPYNQYNNPYNQYNNPYNQYNNPYNQYNNPYNQYNNPNLNHRQLVYANKKEDDIYIAYCITIYMELYPGNTIPPEEFSNLRCTQKWNAVRKAYSDFSGKPYFIPPVHSINKQHKNNTQKNNRTKNNRTKNNRTKKYYNQY
jgi:hypothetical protein